MQHNLVRVEGLEPSFPKESDFKSDAYTVISPHPQYFFQLQNYHKLTFSESKAFKFGTGGEIRTRTLEILSLLPAANWATPAKFEDRRQRNRNSYHLLMNHGQSGLF